MTETLIVAGIIISSFLVINKINSKIKKKIERRSRIHSIKENLLIAQQHNELFDVQFLDGESAIYSVSGILSYIDNKHIRLDVLHHMPKDLVNTEIEVYFRIPIPSGYSFYKFNTKIIHIIEDKTKTEIIISTPESLNVGQPRKFLRITPPENIIKSISLWNMQNKALPSNTHIVGEPDITYKSYSEHNIIRLDNISGSGMAIRIPYDKFHEIKYMIMESAIILCRLVYCLPDDEENMVVFWSTAQITMIRDASECKKNSDRIACVVGMMFTNWAQEQENTLLWFPVVPMSGVTPIIQWVTRLDIERYRYYWGSKTQALTYSPSSRR